MQRICYLCTKICVSFQENMKNIQVVQQECGMLEEIAMKCLRAVLVFFRKLLSLDVPELEAILDDMTELELSQS
jgi:regulatory protein YycH of two-component signal transduction system YycFG